MHALDLLSLHEMVVNHAGILLDDDLCAGDHCGGRGRVPRPCSHHCGEDSALLPFFSSSLLDPRAAGRQMQLTVNLTCTYEHSTTIFAPLALPPFARAIMPA